MDRTGLQFTIYLRVKGQGEHVNNNFLGYSCGKILPQNFKKVEPQLKAFYKFGIFFSSRLKNIYFSVY